MRSGRARRGSARERARRRRRWLLALLVAAAACWLYSRPRSPFGWHPDTLIVHHSATPDRTGRRLLDAGDIDAMHARRHFLTVVQGKAYHIGYHYVVLADGTVQPGRPEESRGAHARHVNDHALGICVIGSFSSTDNPRGRKGPRTPTPAQMRALTALCLALMEKYDIPPERVLRHRDVGQTECPGDRFPFAALQRALREGVTR